MPGLNKFRFVRSDDDGHSAWQCLLCKATFSAPSLRGWQFCPLCGTRWEGQLEWDEEAKAKRKGWYPYAKERPAAVPGFFWVIQEKTIDWNKSLDGGTKDRFYSWRDTRRSWPCPTSAHYNARTAKDVLGEWKSAKVDAGDYPGTSALRLIARYADGREKVLLEYSASQPPVAQEERACSDS